VAGKGGREAEASDGEEFSSVFFFCIRVNWSSTRIPTEKPCDYPRIWASSRIVMYLDGMQEPVHFSVLVVDND